MNFAMNIFFYFCVYKKRDQHGQKDVLAFCKQSLQNIQNIVCGNEFTI